MPEAASQEPNLILPGNPAIIPIDMSSSQMQQFVLAQASFTEDFGMHYWINEQSDGSSLLPNYPSDCC